MVTSWRAMIFHGLKADGESRVLGWSRQSYEGGTVEILIVGTLTVDPERRDALLTAIRPLVQRTRQEEPGCLEYAFTADTVDNDRVVIVERWQDESTLAAHFMHPNFLATKNTLHDLGSGKSIIRKYRVDISEPVRDSEKRYRADFFTVAEGRS